MHLYWKSFPNYLFVVDVLTSFTIWMSIKAFPLPLTEITAELGLLSTDQSWRVLQAPCHATSESLGRDVHRDLNSFFFLSLHSQICYSPQDHLSRGMPDVICESMDGVETQVSVKNNPLVSKAPFVSEVFASTARPGKVSLTRSLFSGDAVSPHLLRSDTFSHEVRNCQQVKLLPLYSGIVRSELECWVQLWASQYRRDMDILERLWKKLMEKTEGWRTSPMRKDWDFSVWREGSRRILSMHINT